MIELTQKFIARTHDDVAQMRASLARLGDGNRSGLDEIRQLAHRACGTGGSLGLMALSDAAGELERLAESFPESAPLGAAERERLGAAVDAVAAHLTTV
jgi:HPt (histidine-containing phosphotransfer) domain-containing protein